MQCKRASHSEVGENGLIDLAQDRKNPGRSAFRILKLALIFEIGYSEMDYVERKIDLQVLIPREANFDLTYRCNLNCRHCWVRIPAGGQVAKQELNTSKIMDIAGQARKMGCTRWNISGGEPMLRPDFADIFDHLTTHSIAYTLNTNGTLISPAIARLMRRPGNKLISIYGADAGIHDHITRVPGSFEAAIAGIRYLQEADAHFTIQLVPLRDNFHQYDQMIQLAKSFTPSWRFGASWIHLGSGLSAARKKEILRQRLPADQFLAKHSPDFMGRPPLADGVAMDNKNSAHTPQDLFAGCICTRNDFYLDPYGKMSFCAFIRDPNLFFDLRRGSFREGWDLFLPSLKGRIKAGDDYRQHCGACAKSSSCYWCPAHSYLENQTYDSKIDYLCSMADETHNLEKKWRQNHQRLFSMAGVSIRVESELPFTDSTFHPKFKLFEADAPGEDPISVQLRFTLPALEQLNLGPPVLENSPWKIFKKGSSWVYICVGVSNDLADYNQVVVFSKNYTSAVSYNNTPRRRAFVQGNMEALTMLPTDQLWLAQVLADRNASIFHCSGVIFKEHGLVFMGHSGAGKSTVAKRLKGMAEILCDDRIALRKEGGGFRMYGTWNNGELPDVSAASTPLRGIFFIKQATRNRIVPISDGQTVLKNLISFVIKPMVTVKWWEKTLDLAALIAKQVPAYTLSFEKEADVAGLLKTELGLR